MSRVSLACVQCRGRHIRCDGGNPCARCRDYGMECAFQKSKRGGRPRKVDTASQSSSFNADLASTPSLHTPDSSFPPSNVRESASVGSSPLLACGQVERRHNAERARLLTLYYAHFHAAHPCTLPRYYYEKHYAQNSAPMAFLDAVMQYVGSLYDLNYEPGTGQGLVTATMPDATSPWNPYDVQAMVHLTTAIFWQDNADKAGQLFQCAITQALRLGMHQRTFAEQWSFGDPIAAESWRRTWYHLYLTDCHIAAITFAPNMRTSMKSIIASVALPCEDHLYQSGEIPQPRTWEEYSNREFDNEESFSSFAELIGLVRIFDFHIIGNQRTTSADSKTICLNADSAMRSWYSLLPRKKREIISEDGTLDETIFKAVMLIPVYTVDVHRALSNLLFDPIEGISTCSPAPPPDHLPGLYRQEVPAHSAKILNAIDSLTELLTLPGIMSNHTPFSICMISSVTIAHLSACKHIFRGDRLTTARERVRVAMGALKAFGDFWARGKRTHSEVKTIARKLLELDAGNNRTGATPTLNAEWPAQHNNVLPTAMDISAFDAGSLFQSLLFDNEVSFDLESEFAAAGSASGSGSGYEGVHLNEGTV